MTTKITEQLKDEAIARIAGLKAEINTLAKELEQAFGIRPTQEMMNGFVFAKLAEIRLEIRALRDKPMKIKVVKAKENK